MQFRRIFGTKSDGKERAIGSTDDGRLKVDADISGGLARMSSDLGTIRADIALMKADLALVNCNTYKGKARTTTTGAAEEIIIPTGSKRVYISCDPASSGHMNINEDATTASFYISSYRDLPAIDLLGVTKLSTWMVAGNASFLFFG